MKPTQDQLSGIAAAMEAWTPQEILRWATESYGPKLAMATAFGAEGCALIAMLSQITDSVYLFNLDTGYQFPETLETRQRLIAKYGLPIHLVRAEQTVEAMEAAHGGPLYDNQPDRCCHLRKVVPLSQALVGYEAWVSAIRRDQTSNRAVQPLVGWDKKFDMVKLNPLANWTKKDVWDYILKNDVPYNPLHDQGFPSIGCWPCTRAVGMGEDDRSGRWAGTAKKECGLHVVNTPVISIR
jgi:phosphoadenosine phosphosulfate reductase